MTDETLEGLYREVETAANIGAWERRSDSDFYLCSPNVFRVFEADLYAPPSIDHVRALVRNQAYDAFRAAFRKHDHAGGPYSGILEIETLKHRWKLLRVTGRKIVVGEQAKSVGIIADDDGP